MPDAKFTTNTPARATEEPLPSFAERIRRWRGHQVRFSVAGFEVRGELSGASEDTIYVRGLHRWYAYPFASISGLALSPERTASRELPARQHVDSPVSVQPISDPPVSDSLG